MFIRLTFPPACEDSSAKLEFLSVKCSKNRPRWVHGTGAIGRRNVCTGFFWEQPMRLFETVSVFLLACATGWAAELAPFAPPWDDATPGPTNISNTLEKPAGKSGFVHVKEGHLYAGDHRLRLFGTNLTGAADFPDHETAGKVAARMAKFGLNAVRFHFLDATWGVPRLIDYESGDSRNWNADALDRLDYFIARLKEEGICADLNLLVGRRFGVGDGVDAEVNRLDWKAAHAVGFFHAPHMEAQKRHARSCSRT